MDKQDRQGLRRVDELDQRYRFSRRFAEIMGIATDSRDTANRALVLADQTIADVRRLTEDGEKWQASIKINADKIEAEVKRATESEGELSSRIQQTAEQIEMIVNDSTTTNGELSSRITQNAASITAEVTRAKGAEGDLSSRITQTAESITSEVNRAKGVEGDLSSRITQTAESITAEVERSTTAEGQLSSRITQNAESITAEVTRAKGVEGDLSSRITQTAESITAEVTRATNAENALSGRISVEAGRVALLVDDSGKVKGSVIVQAINGQSAAKIKADLIEMTGTTTFLTQGDVGVNGKTVIHGGRIDTKTLNVDAANIKGKLDVGDIFSATIPTDGVAASVQIGGFSVNENGLVHDRISIGTYGIGLGSPVAAMESDNVYYTTWISPLGKLISYQPIFHEMTVKGTTRFTGTAGQIVQFAIPILASQLIVGGVDFSTLVARVEALESGSSGGGDTHTHTWGEYYYDNKFSTGYGRDCIVCDYYEDEVPPVDDHEHDFTVEVFSPTCSSGGYTVYSCDCGYSYIVDEMPPLIHIYENGVCIHCGAPENSGGSDGGNACTHPDDSVVVENTVPAKCTQDGYESYWCTECGYKWTDTIQALGHNYELVAAPGESLGALMVCKYCGDQYEASYDCDILGHETDDGEYDMPGGGTAFKCKHCGEFYN
jgi:hypothetical protein